VPYPLSTKAFPAKTLGCEGKIEKYCESIEKYCESNKKILSEYLKLLPEYLEV
jgi:hypothetical protein